MGPGSFDPGNSETLPHGRLACHRFNGAGVFRPRKSAAQRRAAGPDYGFNGAGVFRPRKSPRIEANFPDLFGLQWGRGLSTPEM